jgi:hypothetical protein
MSWIIAGVALAALVLPPVAAPARPVVEGLDHAPIAVTDLDGAAAAFSRLGFLIKPGRPHDDGIRNRHVKFPNGGGIELITAANPTDDLAREYVDWLRAGPGAAFWSLGHYPILSHSHLGLIDNGFRPSWDGR